MSLATIRNITVRLPSLILGLSLAGQFAVANPVQLNCLDPYFNLKREMESKLPAANEVIKRADKKRRQASKKATLVGASLGIGVGLIAKNNSRPYVEADGTTYDPSATHGWAAGLSTGVLYLMIQSDRSDSKVYEGEKDARTFIKQTKEVVGSFRLLQAVERIANATDQDKDIIERESEYIVQAINYGVCRSGAISHYSYCYVEAVSPEMRNKFISNIVAADAKGELCQPEKFYSYKDLSKVGTVDLERK